MTFEVKGGAQTITSALIMLAVIAATKGLDLLVARIREWRHERRKQIQAIQEMLIDSKLRPLRERIAELERENRAFQTDYDKVVRECQDSERANEFLREQLEYFKKPGLQRQIGNSTDE